MKICVATTSFPAHPQDGRAAAGFFVRDFALALAQAGCSVHVLAQENPSGKRVEPRELSVTRFAWRMSDKRPSTLQLSSPNDLAPIATLMCGGVGALTRLSRRERFDCVLAMWAVPAGLWALAASVLGRAPYCVWALGSDIWDYGESALFRPLLRVILRRSVKNYADGMSLVKRVRHIAGTPCTFLPSARRLAPATPERPSSSDHRQFLFIGRWHPNKGIDILLEAMALLQAKKSRAHLDVYGGGSLETKLKRIIEERALPASAVTLHGYIGPDEAARAIRSADCLVIPSRIDSIPVVLSDAVRLGTPVIATSVGDMGDVVSEHQCGLTCPAGDPAALAGAMRDFMETEPGAFHQGMAAATELFDVDRAARSFLEDLDGLGIGRGTGSRHR